MLTKTNLFCAAVIMKPQQPNYDDCEIDIELNEDEYSLRQEERDGIAVCIAVAGAYCFSSDMYELLAHLEDC